MAMWALPYGIVKIKKYFALEIGLGKNHFIFILITNNFIFGSEIKQLLAYGIKPRVNEII
jgi:hypothetical protein